MTSVMPPDVDDHANGSEPDLNTLAAFVDRRLDAPARARVVEHLAECPRCRAIVAELVNAGAARQKQSRSFASALPIAATLLIAAGGGALYFALRDHAPASSHTAAPSAAAPASSSTNPPAADTPSSPSALNSAKAASPGEPASPSAPARRGQPDRTRGVGTKSVAGKTFRLVAGEWIDVDYRRTDLLPVVDITSRSDFDAHGDLQRFAPVGSRFTVVVDGAVYRVQLPPAAK